MQNEFLHEMKAAEILDKTFAIFKKSFWVQIAYNILVNIIFIPIVIFFGITVFVMLFILGMSVNISGSVSSFEISPVLIIIIISLGFLNILVTLFITSLKTIGEMLIAKQKCDKIDLSLSDALKNAFSKLLNGFSALTAKIICFLPIVIIAVILEVIIILAISASVGLNFNLNILQIIICSIVPVIAACVIFYFDTLWLFAMPCATFDNLKFFGALNKSKQLIKGDLRQILGIRVIWFISLMTFNFAVFILIYLVITGFSETLTSFYFEFEMISALIQNFVASVLLMLTKPLTSILTFILYYNQRIKKEGLDIQIKIEHMLALNKKGKEDIQDVY